MAHLKNEILYHEKVDFPNTDLIYSNGENFGL